jgi:ankyrin repeat protein
MYRQLVALIICLSWGCSICCAAEATLSNADAELAELTRVNALIASGADLNAHTEGESPVIFAAIKKGQLKVVTVLLDHGVSVESHLSDGMTLLAAAAYLGQEAAVELLLMRGANAQFEATKDHASLLHYAAFVGSLPVARILLDHGCAVDAKTIIGDTPLLWAAENGHSEIITLLLMRGADVHAANTEGLTALHYAAQFDQPNCIDLLIDRGVAVDVRDNQGQTPLHAAAKAERGEYTKVVVEEEGKAPVITQAKKSLSNRHQPDLSTISQTVTISDKNNDNPDHVVVKTWTQVIYESVQSAQRLIDRGADVNAKDKSGNSPIALTPSAPDGKDGNKYSHDLVAALLKAHGAKE